MTTPSPTGLARRRAAPRRSSRLTATTRALAGLALALAASVAVAAVPVIERPVTDRAKALRADEVAPLEDKLLAHQRATGVQLAVLFVQTTGAVPIEDFALEVASKWGGGERGEDRGLLLVFALQDRRSRLEVGVGLERVITDATAKNLLEAATEHLQSRRFGAAANAIVDGVVARTRHLVAGEEVTPPPVPLGGDMLAFSLTIVLAALVSARAQVLRQRVRRARAPKPSSGDRRGRKAKKKRNEAGSTDERDQDAPGTRLDPAALARTARAGAVWGVVIWIAAPLLIAYLYYDPTGDLLGNVAAGDGFWWAYPLHWLFAAMLGSVAAGLSRSGVLKLLFVIVPLVAGLVVHTAMYWDELMFVGSEVFEWSVWVHIFGLGWLLLLEMITSSGSRSASLRSRHGSTDYGSSSSSYSGGGGSFGGGGASSSW